MDHAGGGAPESNWSQSLDKPLTQELFNFGLLVPLGYRLAKPWRICKDVYPTLTNPATPEQLRVHPCSRYNTQWHAFGARTTSVARHCGKRRRWKAPRVAVRRRSPTHLPAGCPNHE
ncbi:hypothetical protein ZWY2020_023301 [Hordeum vulgare]|nr:hypothetical protein ZWY2020_023301 [Hordeum vulgare]